MDRNRWKLTLWKANAHAHAQAKAQAQAKTKTKTKTGTKTGGVGVTGIAMQLRAITKAAGRDGGRKLLSVALARYTAAKILSATGHKALRGR